MLYSWLRLDGTNSGKPLPSWRELCIAIHDAGKNPTLAERIASEVIAKQSELYILGNAMCNDIATNVGTSTVSTGATLVLPTVATPTELSTGAIPVPMHTGTGDTTEFSSVHTDFIISQQGQSSLYNSWLGPSDPKHSKLNWYVL